MEDRIERLIKLYKETAANYEQESKETFLNTNVSIFKAKSEVYELVARQLERAIEEERRTK